LKDLRRFVRKLFVPHFGNANIAEIKGRHLKSFYLQLEQAPKNIFNVMAALHNLFKDTVEEEVLQTFLAFRWSSGRVTYLTRPENGPQKSSKTRYSSTWGRTTFISFILWPRMVSERAKPAPFNIRTLT